MARALTRGRLMLGTGLFALFLVAVVGVGSAAADLRPFEVAEYRQNFEVPQRQAEESLEVQAAGAEADIVGGLEGRLGSNYAGVWFDNASGKFVVPVLPSANQATIGRELAQDGLRGDYRTVPAQSSWAELEAAQEKVGVALADQLEPGLFQTSIDPQVNAVVVSLSEDAGEAQRDEVEKLTSSMGVRVAIRPVPSHELDVENLTCGVVGVQLCGAPLRGGVGIGYLGAFGGVNLNCTMGFKAVGKTNGNRYMVTAGHCNPEEESGRMWTEDPDFNYAARLVGTLEERTWPGGDWAKYNANGTFWDQPGWPTIVAKWGTNQAWPITTESSSFVGQWVCHSGNTTGTSCGNVTGIDIEVEVLGNGGSSVIEYHMSKFSQVCGGHGDSGGPVFTQNTALGLVSAGTEYAPCNWDLYYAEITEAADSLGVTVAPRTTQTSVETIPLNGNPGWVTVKGHVHVPGGVAINGKYVNLDLRRWENNEWVTKETLHPTVTNNHYEVVNWKVGNGKWLARVVFPEQAPFGESHSDTEHEGNFEIKDGYRLVAKHSGKCLDTIGASYENGALMDQWECANPQAAQGQVFTLVPQGEYFQLVVRKSGRCLDVPGASQSDGTQLQQYTCLGAGQANQLWKLTSVDGTELFKLTAKHSGKCLDVAGGGTANGAKVQQWGCNGQNQQKWSFQSVESPAPATETTATIPPNGTLNGQPGFVTVNGKVQAGAYPLAGKSLNVNYSKETSPGVWTYMNTSHPTLNSEGAYSYPNWQVAAANWRVRTVFPGGEGLAESVSGFQYFTIKSGYRFVWRHSGKCMTLSENSAANGKPIIQWPCFSPPSPGDGQVFTLVPFANGYEIKINSTGKCVDVTNVSTANGAKLQQWDCLGAGQTNQIWSLVELAGQPGWFAFIAAHSGKCAEVPSSSTANGAWFQQWTCNWTGNQQFAIQAIS